VQLLPMNIGLLYSLSTNIIFDLINRSCSFSLLVWLATNCPLELVSSCSQNLGQTTVSQWHTLCIHVCYFSLPNIPLKHLFFASIVFIYFWSTIGYRSKFRGVLTSILIVPNLHLQWRIFIFMYTMPLSHYIQSFKMFVSIV
jgi:hypothetical protein